MSEYFFSNYFYTRENYRIFYSTNFNIAEYDPQIPLLVFNYGLVCNKDHWKYQIPYFVNKGFQVITHDYRFHYSSSGHEENIEECNFEGITCDLIQLLESFKAKNIFMLGHSMGVNITLEYAKRDSHLLSGIVLISGSVLPPQDVMFDTNWVDIITPYVEKIYDTYPHLYKKFWSTTFLNPLAREIVFRGGFNTSKVPEEFIQVYMKRIGELPPKIFLKLLREMQSHDILKDLGNIRTPALIMGGDQDKVIPNYLQQILLDKLPNAELYIVKDGSHVPQADFPTSTNERILSFIEKNSIA